jgi:hypothetical protein
MGSGTLDSYPLIADQTNATLGSELVTNGDFSQEGSELVVCGGFTCADPNATWSPVGLATISSGVASFVNNGTNANSYIQQNILQSNKLYKITFDVTRYVVGGLQFVLGGTTYTIDISAGVNTYTAYLLSGSTDTTFRLKRNGGIGNFNFDVDNVSVKEVGQDWELFGVAAIDGNAIDLIDDGSNTYSGVRQDVASFVGKQYEIKITVTNWVQGSVLAVFGSNNTDFNVTGDGDYTAYLSPSSTGNDIEISRDFSTGANFSYSISNISVKEVGQHWTLNGTASISDGKAHINSPSGELAEITQTNALVIGRNYRLTCDLDKTSGDTQFVNGGTFILVNGFNTINFTANSTIVYFKRGAGSVISSLDNIVVQELKHDATNLMLNAGAYQSANPLITSTKSMEFDGGDDYLQLSEPFSHTNHTITGWFKLDVNNASQEIFSAADNGNDGIRIFISSSGEFKYRIGNASSSNTLTYASVLDTDKWYNFATTYDNTTQKIYIDGVNVTNSTSSFTISTTTNSVIGKRSFDNVNYYNGQVTEIGTFDRVLTSLEVASLYNQGMPTNLLVNRNNYQSGNPTVFNTKQVCICLGKKRYCSSKLDIYSRF